jgi:short subunit dehydrogenase-like uncharacterized protein
MPEILVYGATGYTGKLVAQTAKDQGMTVVLAGRNLDKVRSVAEPLGFEARAAGLDDPAGLKAILSGISAVLHIAGPFSATSKPMADACLAAQAHYLDITGEISVFEALAGRDNEAGAAGIVLMPGVGFDVVPSDCLLAHVAKRLPDTIALKLGLSLGANISHGTAKTMVESLGGALSVRRAGRIMQLPPGSLTRTFDFGQGPENCIAVGWGDVSTAYHSTGVGDIETYFLAAREMKIMSAMSRYLGPLLATGPVQRFLKAQIDKLPEGPTPQQRAEGRSLVVAQAIGRNGATATSRLTAPEGYSLTALTALEAARRLANGEVTPGFKTPSLAFGADFILDFPGVTRSDF